MFLWKKRKSFVLDTGFPPVPPSNAPGAQKDAYEKHLNDSVDVTCLMLATMVPDLQKQFEAMEAFHMMRHLKEMFQEQVRQERFLTMKALNECKMAHGTSVSAHVLKMKGHLDQLERLGAPLSKELAIDTILGSLPSSYD